MRGDMFVITIKYRLRLNVLQPKSLNMCHTSQYYSITLGKK